MGKTRDSKRRKLGTLQLRSRKHKDWAFPAVKIVCVCNTKCKKIWCARYTMKRRNIWGKKTIADLSEGKSRVRNSLLEEICDTFHDKWDRSFVDPRYVIKYKNTSSALPYLSFLTNAVRIHFLHNVKVWNKINFKQRVWINEKRCLHFANNSIFQKYFLLQL